MVNFDNVLQEVNEFGSYQKLRFVLILIAATIPGFITYIHSFTSPKLNYICNQIDFGPNVTYSNVTYDKCHYIVNDVKYPCNSWNFDKTYYKSTLTEEWSMVCDRSFLSSNVQMIYFSGYLVGSFMFGYLADVFGRRPIMLSSFLFIIFGGIGVAFGPQDSFGFLASYLIYTFSRFLIACGTRGINVTGYILALEIVGPSQRAFAAMTFTSFFAIGQLFLVTAAYFLRDWRTLAGFMVVPLLPFLGYYFIIAESPRWLISKNRTSEAHDILKKIAKKNKRELNEDSWTIFIRDSESETQEEAKENMVDLIKSPRLVIITLLMFINWIVNNLAFYGLGLKSNDLGVNPYLSFLIAAIVELIAYLVCMFALTKFGRKYPYMVCLYIGGLACISMYFIEENIVLTVVLAMVGKFAISISYAIIHLYSSEMFPTTLRGSCQGACSMMARFGSIIAPAINSLDEVYKGLPFLVFGATALLAGLSSMVLPETANRKLPRNLAEAENIKTLRCVPSRCGQSDTELNDKQNEL